jgi:hypothetical protein
VNSVLVIYLQNYVCYKSFIYVIIYFSNISRLLQFNLTERNQSNGYAHDRCNSAETWAAERSRDLLGGRGKNVQIETQLMVRCLMIHNISNISAHIIY